MLIIPDKSSRQNIMCDVTPVNDSVSSDGDFEPALDISLLPKVSIFHSLMKSCIGVVDFQM